MYIIRGDFHGFQDAPRVAHHVGASPNRVHMRPHAYSFCYTAVMANKGISPEDLFRALADATRLRILHLIGDREVCVCYFVETLDVHQPKVSRHLAYLRRSGLVEARRDGKWIHYKLATLKDPIARRVVKDAIAWTHELAQAKKDLARFDIACCQPEKFVTLHGAPVPTSTLATNPGM
jgi:ArsR family transcriptional regulator, arsenate/arsenite/antimonite-responsive transcriptional repressor